MRVDGGKQQQAQSVASAASPTTTSRVNVGVGNSRLGSADVDLALRDFPWWHGDLATREASKARLNAEKGRAAQRQATLVAEGDFRRRSGGGSSSSSNHPVDGTFLVRPSSKGTGFYACDLFVRGGKYLPMLIEQAGHRFRLQPCTTAGIELGGPKTYRSLEQLIERNQEYLNRPCPRST